MDVFTVVMAAVLGLAVGSFLNVVVVRVPERESLLTPSHCPKCAAPIRAWQNIPVVSWLVLRGRCHECQAPISPRYPLVEAGTAAAFAIVAGISTRPDIGSGSTVGAAGWLAAGGLCAFAAVSIALALIDRDTHRLPDTIVLRAYPAAFVLLLTVSAVGGDWPAFARAMAGAVVMLVAYYAMHFARPDGMGFGDVKLAGLLGMVTAYVGWGALVVGFLAAFVLGGAWGLALLSLRRATRRSGMPFGPWMIAGAWFALALGEQLTTRYLQVSGLS